MTDWILKEKDFIEQMEKQVIPYLQERRQVRQYQREPDKNIYCDYYEAEHPAGVILISHGFTETAEKYQECIYYFLLQGYHVYCMEHCGHGHSYRMTGDLSLVHIDGYDRYVADLLYVAEATRREQGNLPLYLYAHSMGGGIGAAAASKRPELFQKVILTSPMIRPATGPVPWPLAKLIAGTACLLGKEESYVVSQGPYRGNELFEKSATTSPARFTWYIEKRQKEPLYQMNGPSYRWLHGAAKLNRYLMSEGWKTMTMPVLLFQADKETFVSKKEQTRFVKKLNTKGRAELVFMPESRHEIYNGTSAVLEKYWKRVFTFLQEA